MQIIKGLNMYRTDLFNQDSICIFTDSSFSKDPNCPKNKAIGTTAPAFCVYNGDSCIQQGYQILPNSTSQQGELYALLLGVFNSYKYRNFPHIRIFSDNQNAVFAIRERIFKWVEDTENGKLVLGDNGDICNQAYILNIVNTILYNNIFIELYHIKGHVNIKNEATLKQAKDTFRKSNPFVGRIEDDTLIYQLALGNNCVDEYSTAMLYTYLFQVNYNVPKQRQIISLKYKPFDVKKYGTLVNKNGRLPVNKQL